MGERTPMETLREIERALTEFYDVMLNRRPGDPVGFVSLRVPLEAMNALAMLRDLLKGAVEGFVTGETGNCRFDDGSTCITSALPSRPALLLTTKPRGEG